MENLNVTVDLPVICTRGMLVFQDMNCLWM